MHKEGHKGNDDYRPQRQAATGMGNPRPWLRPYPAYKESRVEWVGRLPSHWEVKRLKYVLKLNPSAAAVRNLGGSLEVSFLPMEAVGEYGGLDLTSVKPLAEVNSGYTYFGEGDIVVARITPCFENGKGALAAGLVNGIAFGTTELHVLRTRKAVDPRFLFYVSMSDAFRKLGEAEMYGAGGQKRVPESFVENLRHPLPPLAEQRAIASFLDRETAKIDTLVAKKERLIELLQEKRAALITRVVTEGLDPDVPMKDSAIPRLGRIPAHWHVTRIRDIAVCVQTGPFDSQLHADDYTSDGTPVINPVNLVDGCLVPDFECTVDAATCERLQQHQLRDGDILFARRGELGRCGLVNSQQEGWLCGTGCLRMRTRSDVAEPLFLLFGLSTGMTRRWLEIESVGSTMQNLNSSIISRISVAIPDLDEQRYILDILVLETARIDALMANVGKAIDRLKELRTALISAAVTGKIDVRNDTDANPEPTS